MDRVVVGGCEGVVRGKNPGKSYRGKSGFKEQGILAAIRWRCI